MALHKAMILTALGALALAGCTERDTVLGGERLNVRDVLQTRGGGDIDTPGPNVARAIALPGQNASASWAQSGVSPHARAANAAFSGRFQPVFAISIGRGDTRRNRLNVDPVVGGGRVFTMDSAHVVRATSTGGGTLWEHDLTPLRDKAIQAQGGGLAVSDRALYVSSGFGMLVALDPATGREIWKQDLGNTATGAPSYRDGVVYVTSGDQTGWALEADTGRVRWQIDGAENINNVAGAPAPAIGDTHVIFSFGSGTLQGALRQGGLRVWNADILGRRNGFAISTVNDITGDPLISGETVFAGNHAGRVVALGLYNGERKWTAREGALGPLWPAGDSVFFVSDRNQLIRLDAATGEQVWAVDLPGYKTKRNPNKRRSEAYANLGPILAGNRLIVAGSDGYLRAFAPESGALVGSVPIDGGATTRPVVAGGTLYVVSGKGVLHAYR
ncbi:PQQ-like beta-propeller repeat protein [Ponticoccus alexandrii]|uniref:PQQ-binding-like beta-propeller repeat protein n=1 Tax=Ponticoccus alexandrii TaxID=1943633 RepID=A0ABX7F963_9RHOB|nr:PQQ-like beta-propeller repeat protein [Ponticoccus alexandrii]ETA52677.1 quinoprotein [Rhodobacteraceae bacterium PD-2]QRF67086.1 PQQ-binding-like beta-propeller repeat protein [Ponticoccus alexandrii]